MNFKIGQKVVCINIDHLKSWQALKLNKIYTIESFVTCRGCKKTSIILKELVEAGTQYRTCITCGNRNINKRQYSASRFRPLVEQPEKISNVLNNKDIIKELIEERSDVKIKEKV